MNDPTRQLLNRLQGMEDPRGLCFVGSGDWISAVPSALAVDQAEQRLDLVVAEDGGVVVAQGPRIDVTAFDSPDDWLEVFRLQWRFRLLRCTLSGNRMRVITPRLEFFLPGNALPPEGGPAYGMMLDYALTILPSAAAYLRKRTREGLWDASLIEEDPEELKALRTEVLSLEKQLDDKRRREDQIRKAVSPRSRVLPHFL